MPIPTYFSLNAPTISQTAFPEKAADEDRRFLGYFSGFLFLLADLLTYSALLALE
jgi:hypothetical protein